MMNCMSLKKYGFSLMIADVFISTMIIFPLSVLHWDGTWVLQDEYFFPENKHISTMISLSLGATVCTFQLLMQPQLAEWVKSDTPAVYILVTRIHLYIHGWAILCYWRGIWNILDLIFDSNSTLFLYIVLFIYIICQLLMILMRTVRTAVGAPIALRLDTSDNLLEADVVFKTSHENFFSFTLDCLFTQFVVVTASITVWWAVWWMLDVTIFEDQSYDWICFLVGFTISLLLLLLQVPLSWMSEQLEDKYLLKLAYEDTIFIILTWANIMFWRGFWNIWVNDFLPKKLVGSWVSHVIGTVGLLLLQSFNNVGLHGIDRDGSYQGGSGIFPNKYLQEILKDFSLSTTIFKRDVTDPPKGAQSQNGDECSDGFSQVESDYNHEETFTEPLLQNVKH